MHLCQPMWKGEGRLVAGALKRSNRRGDIAFAKKEIEIFGVANHSRIAPEGVGATDEKRDFCLTQHPHCVRVKLIARALEILLHASKTCATARLRAGFARNIPRDCRSRHDLDAA